MAKYLPVLFFVLLVSPLGVQSWDFFGLFKKTEPTTTVSPPTTSSPALSQTAATTTEANGACWWTQCGTRCTATASVHDFNSLNCNPGQYKFRCCSV
ncbi:hypothetical protein Ocin01_14032 [Orchesella cincta]|uniref:Uncharacterized protein n=1 Tax=Orchesella cincta TaxID=48709 RepID=A0A1D2MI12_ORCCI|nr:hypothetical protein Ocin01_14032 [Orchesella cincta]